jgi:hypothetical protein
MKFFQVLQFQSDVDYKPNQPQHETNNPFNQIVEAQNHSQYNKLEN